MKISKSILHAIATVTTMSVAPSAVYAQTAHPVPEKANPNAPPSKGQIKSATDTTFNHAPAKSDSTIVRPKRRKGLDPCLGCGRG